MRGEKVIVVTPDSSKELKERVYRLRYQVYVEEMKHNLANEERMLHDKYDEYSTNFLAEVDGQDVGTMRYTAKRDGPLESEEQNESWRSLIWSSERDPSVVCELARWIVRRDFRGSSVGPMVGYATIEHCMRENTFKMYCWNKSGPVAEYNKKLGLQVRMAEPLPFKLGDYVMGLYILMHLDFGSPWSLRRTGMRLRYGFRKVLAKTSLPLLNTWLRRRGKGYTHQK